jgi:hypothetical protein
MTKIAQSEAQTILDKIMWYDIEQKRSRTKMISNKNGFEQNDFQQKWFWTKSDFEQKWFRTKVISNKSDFEQKVPSNTAAFSQSRF